MSQKIDKSYLYEKLQLAFPNNKVEILEWNGYTKPITYRCDICGEQHHVKDARQLLNKRTYCVKNDLAPNKKWDIQEYNERINRVHKEKVTIIEYNGLSGVVKYLCPRCG